MITKRLQKGFVLVFAGVLLFLAGCGKQPAPISENPGEEASREDTDGKNHLAAQERLSKSDDPSGQASPTGGGTTADQGEPPLSQKRRDLTKQELQDFTIWINQGSNYGNYGFLLSQYDRPQNVNLGEVFYSGAGLHCKPLSPEEERAYLKATGQEEIYTDCTRLTTSQINGFLEQKLGLTLKEMGRPFTWLYLPEFDIYVYEHGDTNYMHFTCVDGRQLEDGTYELDCVPGDGLYDPMISPCRLRLEKYRNDYRFLSNTYAEDLVYSREIWKIDEQSFSTELDGWGRVEFVSYAPDPSRNATEDALFTLTREGETIYTFPYVEEDNFRRGQTFREILAVSFSDYDQDGDPDVIILVEYTPLINTEEGENLREVRLYQNQPQNAAFLLDMGKMESLNGNGWNHTIQEVLENIGEE